jgi:hypothetical protein
MERCNITSFQVIVDKITCYIQINNEDYQIILNKVYKFLPSNKLKWEIIDFDKFIDMIDMCDSSKEKTELLRYLIENI